MGYAGEAKSANGTFEGFEVFIKYLPPSTTEQQLVQHFEHCGPIVGAPRLLKAHDGACKGVGWITFETHDAHAKAIRANGTPFRGRNLQVTPAKAAHTGFRPSVQAAGTHTPAMLHECTEQLVEPDRDGVVVDATFGRGGHSRGMLAALSERGTLHGFDMDHDAMASAEELKAADKRFCIHHAPFSRMREHLGDGSVSGVLFDLGISSPQFDEAHRGFRPEADGPLDLRFDQSRGETAFEYLLRVPREELIRVLVEGGETSDAAAARRIADAIILARENGKLPRRTQRFAALVAAAKGVEYQAMHPAKLTFQALRIHLNDEFGELCRGVRASFHLLREGGRIGVITWKHSECALLIDVFRTLEAVRDDMPQMAYLRETEPHAKLEKGWALEMTRTIRPSSNELATNSRSRSAVLHIMTKVRKATVVQLERKLYATLGWEAPPAAEGEEVVSPQVDEARDNRPASGKKKKTKKKKRKQGAGEAAPTAESAVKELMSKKQKQKPSS